MSIAKGIDITWSHPTRVRGLKSVAEGKTSKLFLVAPHAGAWIEIRLFATYTGGNVVAPHAGAWIEIALVGLCQCFVDVAPHAGAWIEIYRLTPGRGRWSPVAPHAGAWIEIDPSRSGKEYCSVAPHMGA